MTMNSTKLTSGKYFNKGVKALDAPHVGHVVRETPDAVVVFGGKQERYDIPIKEIQQVGANVLIGLPFTDIIKKYTVSRKEPLPARRKDPWPNDDKVVDLATYEGKYPMSLFNKGVRANDEGFPPQGNLVDDTHYTQLITKDVLTNDRKYLGHVDGFDNINIIVKNGLFNPQYYKIPRAKVDGYKNGKVLLNISEQDTKRQFKKKYPGYFN